MSDETVTVEIPRALVEVALSAVKAYAEALRRSYAEGCLTGDEIRARGTDAERLRGVFLDADKT